MLQIAAYIFAACFGVGLIAWALCRGGSLIKVRDDEDREVRRIREQATAAQ